MGSTPHIKPGRIFGEIALFSRRAHYNTGTVQGPEQQRTLLWIHESTVRQLY